MITADLTKILKLTAFQSTEAARLCGVSVETSQDFPGYYLAATDGHTLGMFEDRLTFNPGVAPAIADRRAIIVATDKDFVANAKRVIKNSFRSVASENLRIAFGERPKLATGGEGPDVMAEIYVHDDTVAGHGAPETPGAVLGNSFSVHIIDGSFPDWRRVFPTDVPRVSDQLGVRVDHRLVARFGLGHKDESAIALYTQARDKGQKDDFSTSPIIVVNVKECDFIGLLMPFGKRNSPNPLDRTPTWFRKQVGLLQDEPEEALA